MNFNNICFYDFETGSANPFTCQPIQLSSIIIDGRRLVIRENSVFNSYIKPITDNDKCKQYNLDNIQDDALEVNKIKREQLDDAPELKVVWNIFQTYLKKYSKGKGIMSLPIRAGFNIERFDNIILDRIMGGHNRAIKCLANKGILSDDIKIYEPWEFGPWDLERQEQRLFNARDCIDMMKCYIWPWTENSEEIKSISMKAIKEWLGLSDDYAHNSIADVIVGAHVLIRFMKLVRNIAPKVNFYQSMKEENTAIQTMIKQYI